MELKDYETCKLVDELKRREGVTSHWAEPYEELELKIEGAAVVLVVID